MKTRFQAKLENMKRRYYEVFGDLEAQNEFLKLNNLILLMGFFLAVFGAFILAKQPPFVVRVNEVGKAETIQNIHSNNAPSVPEILDFASVFVKSFRGLNSYTLSDNSSEAWNRMSARYQRIANRDLIESGFLKKLDKTGLYTRIEMKEEKIERETTEYGFVSLIGVRTLLNYNDPGYLESSLFKADLVLKKVPRTRQIPWGLLVENYNEVILNKLEENK